MYKTQWVYPRIDFDRYSFACDERAKYGDAGAESAVVRFDLTRGLGAQDVDERIGRGRRAGDIGHRTVAFYFADCADRGLHQTFGHSSVVPYAIRRHGIPRRCVRDLVAAGRALQELVKVDAAFVAGELPWSKVRAIAKVADVEHEEQWIAFAKTHGVEEVEREASLAKKGQAPRDHRKGTPPVRFKLQLSVSPLVNEQAVLARQKLGAELGRESTDEEFAGALLEAYLRRPGENAGQASDSLYRVVLDYSPATGETTIRTDDGPIPLSDAEAAAARCDAGVCGHDGKPHAGHAPPASDSLRRRVLARDGFRCRVCTSRVVLNAHHIKYRENLGQNELWNLITLCKRCHVLVHDDFLMISGRAPDRLSITDRTGASVTDPAKLVNEIGPRLEIGPPSGPAGPLPGQASGSAGSSEPALAAATMPAPATVDFDRLPARVDAGWMDRHARLITKDDRHGVFLLEPGVPSEARPEGVAADAPDAAPSGPAGPLNSGCAAEIPGLVNDPALRPDRFSDVVGQPAAVASLRLAVRAYEASGEMPDHVLLSGRPGLGKTTLARAFARELGGRLRVIDATTLESPLTLIGHLLEARDRDVVFLDEIHALKPRLAELLYAALEDGVINLPFSDGVRTKSILYTLPKLTFVGATTNPGRLPEPLVARFPVSEELERYSEADLAEIVRRAALRNGLAVDGEAATVLARASSGCARMAMSLYKCLRRLMRAERVASASVNLANAALEAAQIDANGLGPVHRNILDILRRHGRPMKTQRLARAAGLTLESFRTLYEPILFELGAIVPTARGMMLGNN